MKARLSVPFPAEATEFQFAESSELFSYEFYLTFRAPPEVCLAYARAVVDQYTKPNPKNRMALEPITPPTESEAMWAAFGHETAYLGLEEIPLPWFNPGAIQQGVAGGDRPATPAVWVDTERGIFYYEDPH